MYDGVSSRPIHATPSPENSETSQQTRLATTSLTSSKAICPVRAHSKCPNGPDRITIVFENERERERERKRGLERESERKEEREIEILERSRV